MNYFTLKTSGARAIKFDKLDEAKKAYNKAKHSKVLYQHKKGERVAKIISIEYVN